MAALSANPLAMLYRCAAFLLAAGLWLVPTPPASAAPNDPVPVTQDRLNEVAAALMDLPAHFTGLTARRRPNEPAAAYASRLRGYVAAAERAVRVTAALPRRPALRDASPSNRERWARLEEKVARLDRLSGESRKCVAEMLNGGHAAADPSALARTGAALVGVLDTTNAITQDLRNARP